MLAAESSLLSSKHRRAVHEHDMASHAELQRRFGALDRVVERLAIGHECGGGYDTIAMGFNNGAVHTLSEPKIIRIDDQTSQAPV
jgi:hypothetical protein